MPSDRSKNKTTLKPSSGLKTKRVFMQWIPDRDLLNEAFASIGVCDALPAYSGANHFGTHRVRYAKKPKVRRMRKAMDVHVGDLVPHALR